MARGRLAARSASDAGEPGDAAAGASGASASGAAIAREWTDVRGDERSPAVRAVTGGGRATRRRREPAMRIKSALDAPREVPSTAKRATHSPPRRRAAGDRHVTQTELR